MFKEYDIVKIKKQIENVPIGTLGTVLIVYENNEHYEVEFVDDNGESINILTVSESDLQEQDL